jgi:hypothetical protein
MVRTAFVVSLLSLAASAISGCADETAWAPPVSEDEIVLVDGSAIPSRFADPANRYLSKRPMKLIDQFGIFKYGFGSQELASLIARLDHGDSRMHLVDLVALEDELTSEELIFVDRLWELMVVPDMQPVSVRVPDVTFQATLTAPTATAQGEAKVALSAVLSTNETTNVGDVHIESLVDLKVVETRELTSSQFLVSSKIIGKRTHWFGAERGQLLAIHLETGNDYASEAPRGQTLIENYASGARTAFLVDWPDSEDEVVPLDEFADYMVVGPTGSRLEKFYEGNQDGVVSFKFYPGPPEYLSGADADVVDNVATPISSLTPGRYQVTPQIALDIYETGLVIAHHAGTSQRLAHANELDGTTRRKALKGDVAGAPLVFFPEANRLYIVGTPVTVTSSMRTN